MPPGHSNSPDTASNTEETFAPNFDIYLLDEKEIDSANKNTYISSLSDKSFISILQPGRVKKAFDKEETRESELFHLFLSRSFFDCMLQWTNTELQRKGEMPITIEKLMACVGLEIAMSIVQIGSIKQYWETSHFSGQSDFRDTMSRTDFEKIRAAIQFHPPDAYNEDIVDQDPLWHSLSQVLLIH